MTPDKATRQDAFDLLQALALGDLGTLAPDHRVAAVHPFGQGDRDAAGAIWEALRAAMPDLERRDDIFLMGQNRPDARLPGPRPTPLVATLGGYLGTFERPFLGIPPTGGVVCLPYG
ncbi:MAG: hypothetical protein AAGK57_05895, partial [Pseudomonadota bacterium]